MKKILLKSVFSGLCLILPLSGYALDQWATKVLAFSTQWSTGSWSANQVLKTPNVNAYGDNPAAWTTSSADAGPEYVTVSYTTPVYATGATIRETFGAGFVTSVVAIDTADVPHTVWTGVDNSTPGQINNFQVTWPKTTYLVKALKININTALKSGYEEIDAIQLRGIEPLSGKIAPRFGHTATLVCKNVTTNQTKTVTIKGTGATAPVTQWDCEKAGLIINNGNTVSIQITGVIAQ